MFDLSRMGLPSIEEAHGKKWLCIYLVTSTDDATFYIAVEATGENMSKPLPQQCSLISVPLPPEVVASRKKRAEERAKEGKPGG